MPRWIYLKEVPGEEKGDPVFSYKEQCISICRFATQRQDARLDMEVFDKHLELLKAVKAAPETGWWKLEEHHYALLKEKVAAITWGRVNEIIADFLHAIRDAATEEPKELVDAGQTEIAEAAATM